MGNVLREDFRSAHVLVTTHSKPWPRSYQSSTPLLKLSLTLRGTFSPSPSCDTLVQQLQVGGLDLISFGLAAFKNWEKDICDPNISDLRGSSSNKLRLQCLQARQWYPNDFARMHWCNWLLPSICMLDGNDVWWWSWVMALDLKTQLWNARCLTGPNLMTTGPLIVSKSSLDDDHQNHSVVQVSPQSEAADSLSAEAANCGRYCIGSFQDGDWPNALQEITKCCLSSLSSAKGQNEAATNSGSRCQEPKLNLRCELVAFVSTQPQGGK